MELDNTYRDFQISVHEHLELPRGLALISDNHTCSQPILTQCNAVDQPELVWPRLLALLAQIIGAQSKIQLHAAVTAIFARRGFGG